MKRILVALDGSPRAPGVLAAAARLAKASDAKLVLFRAIGIPPEIPREVFVEPELRIEDILRRQAREDLDKVAASVAPELVEQTITELGTAWDSITRTAKRVDADLVVIGSHGYGGLDRLLGTTAAKVVNHIDRNVLVVRTPL
jgi:nucleotide-binding universal stress UspA family protein